MLSQTQIDKLTLRVSELRAELLDKMDQNGVQSEQAIEQELGEALELLRNDKDNSDVIELAEGLKQTAELLHLINIMEEWILTKQVNKQLHRNHPELAAIGFIFSPRGSTPLTIQPIDPEKIYNQRVSNEVEIKVQDAMMFLYSMGFPDFSINLEALKLALVQGVTQDELVDQALENINSKKNPTKMDDQMKKQDQDTTISVIKKSADEKVDHQQPIFQKVPIGRVQVETQPRPEVITQHNNLSLNPEQQLKILEQLKLKILEGRSSQRMDQQQTSQLESQFRDMIRNLVIQKENLQKQLKFQQEPSVQKIAQKIAIYLEEDDQSFNQKIKDHQLYKDLVSLIPQYESFINEKPKQEFQTFDQVMKALSLAQKLQEKLKILDQILFEAKEFLYLEALQNLDELFNTGQYQKMKRCLDSFAQEKDWNQMNITLVQSFIMKESQDIILKHSSVKYFLHFSTEEINDVMNPLQIQALSQGLELILKNETNFQLKLQLEHIMKFFLEGNIEEAMKVCNTIPQQQKINKLFQDYNLKHFINHLVLKSSLLKNLESLKVEEEFRQSQYVSALTSTIAVSCEKTMIINCFFQLHQRHDPKFKQNHFLDLISVYTVLNDHLNIGLQPIDFIVRVIDDPTHFESMKDILQNLEQVQNQNSDFMNQVQQEGDSLIKLRTILEQFSQQDPTSFKRFAIFIERFPGINYNKARGFIQESLNFEVKLQKALKWSNNVILQGDKKSLYTIKDFMKIDIYMNLESLENKICNDFQKKERIIKDELANLLFEMIKKRLSFDKFIERLYRDFETTQYQITSMNLFCYLLDSCDSELRSMLFLACSNYMPVPLIANRPQVNFFEKYSEQQKYEDHKQYEEYKEDILQYEDDFQQDQKYLPRVYEELMYSFEKYKGILAFKVNTNKDRSLRGCTTLTNKIFNRQFELHSSLAPIANYGQAEIQFDFNFAETHFVTVGEVHGYLENQELFTLLSLFDIFLIHCFKEDIAEVKNIMKKISKGSLVFIIHQDDKAKNSYFLEKEQSPQLIEFNISSLNILERNHLNNMSLKINQRVKKHISEWKEYMQNVNTRIQTLQEFAEFCLSFNAIHNQVQCKQTFEKTPKGDDNGDQEGKKFGPRSEMKQIRKLQNDFEDKKNYIVDTVNMIREFIERIYSAKKSLKTRHVLPINEHYSRICINENKIQRDLSIKSDAIENLRNINEAELTTILQTDQSEISKKLHSILSTHDQYVGIVSVLAKLIKCIINSILDPQFTERARLQDDASKQGISIQKKDQIAEDIKIITDQIEKQSFSMEFLFREFYIKEKIVEQQRKKNPQSIQSTVKPYEMYFQIARQQIENGQPFELIDGDNLRFIHSVYEKIQNDDEMNDEVLVISVIGPQSSGKSLLLNTLFGTQFQSSAGRCTKGVYGCLIDIKEHKEFTRFQKILILDTEGIQSTEKKDSGFDHRIVFYILCISHIVLVCNKGEINSQMQEMIKIAVYSLSEFKTLVNQMPQVNIIMNMIPQIDERNLEQTYQNLAETLIQMGVDKDDSHLMLNIKKENVFMLPQAFSNQGDDQDLLQGKSSPIFAAMTQKLNQNIFTFMKNAVQDNRNYTLNSFFRKAAQTWEMVNNYHDIDKFSSLEQRKQGMDLQQHINKIIDDQFKLKKQEIQQRVEQVADLELQKYPDTSIIQRKQLFDKIDSLLFEFRIEIQDSLIKLYENYCQEKQIEKKVVNLYTDNLHRMIKTNFIEWQSIINSKIQKYFESKFNIRGNKQLQEVIEIVLASTQDKFEEKEAEEIFNQSWKVLINERELELKNIESIKNEAFDYAYHFYRNQVKGLGPKEEDINLLNEFINSNYSQKSLLDFMEYKRSETGDELQQDFLSFTGHSKPLEPEKFLQRYESIGKYIPKLNYYTLVHRRELYDWNQVVIERFNFSNLEYNLQSQLYDRYTVFYKHMPINRGTSIIQSIIEKIKIEGQRFQIGITQDFELLLFQIKDQYKCEYIYKIKDSFPRIFLKQQIDKIKSNILQYFKYQSYSNKNIKNHDLIYQYFEPKRILELDTSFPVYNVDFRKYRYTCFDILHQDKYQNLLPQRGKEEVRISYQELIPNRQLTKNNDALNNYLEQIQRAESFNLQGREKAGIQARKFFFEKLQKQEIIQKIQEVVLNNIYRLKDNPYKKNNYLELIQLLKHTKDVNITSQFAPLDQNIFQRIAPEIQKIVTQIDNELEAFCLNVSDQGIFVLHQIAQTLLTCIFIEIIRIYEYTPLFNFQSTEETERKLFVAKLTNKDEVRDKSLAEKASKHLFKMINDKIKQEQIEEFSQVVQKYNDYFKLENIINEIEGFILKVSIDFQLDRKASHQGLIRLLDGEELEFNNEESKSMFQQMKYPKKDEFDYPERNLTWSQIIQMYVEPDKFFDMYFQQSWKIKTDDEIQNLQISFKGKRDQILLKFIAYFKMFKKLMVERKMNYAINLFLPQGFDSKGNDDEKKFLQYCDKACALYFSKILRSEWNPKENFQIDLVEVKADSTQAFIHQDDLKQFQIENIYKSCIVENLENEMISSLLTFVDSIIQCLETERKHDVEISKDVLIVDQEHEMRKNSVGCGHLCPLCRRKCEIIHKQADEDHSCNKSGHQILGFGGSYHARNKYAITYGCHELDNHDKVEHEGQQKMWFTYKLLFKDWDFSENKKLDSSKHKEQNIKIWNLIGPIICRYYNIKMPIKNSQRKFVMANNQAKRMGSIEHLMYFVVLDSSGSMQGDKWTGVLEESKKFIEILCQDQVLKEHSKITCISYDESSTIEFENEVPNPLLIDSIQFQGGGTDFNSPLMKVKKIAEKYLDDFHGFHVCFLSDGEADYPQEAVDAIKENKELLSKFRLTTVAFGNDQSEIESAEEVLKRLAQEFGSKGCYKKALEPEDFKNALIEMIPNVYLNKIE